MKTLLFFLLGSVGLAPFATAAAADTRPASTLYVTLATDNPAAFERSRYSRATGDELIVRTLREFAAKEAEFAQYPGEVVVLDLGREAPAGADVLRLTWTAGSVTADLIRAAGRPKYLGMVSRRSFTFHPEREVMDREIRRAGMPDQVRDARLRVATRMQLHLALERAVAVLGSSS